MISLLFLTSGMHSIDEALASSQLACLDIRTGNRGMQLDWPLRS